MIVVATDHKSLRNQLTEFLSQQGYEVVVSPHSQEVCTFGARD